MGSIREEADPKQHCRPQKRPKKSSSLPLPAVTNNLASQGRRNGQRSSSSTAFTVLTSSDLLAYISALQRGRRYADWHSGDQAAARGHLSLLKLKRRQEEEPAQSGPDAEKSLDGRGGKPVPLFFTANAKKWAIKARHLELLQWLHRYPFADQKAFFAGLINSTKERSAELASTLEHYRQSLESSVPELFELAASSGHHGLVAWLEAEYLHFKPNLQTIMAAVRSGDVNVLRWLCQRAESFSSDEVLRLINQAIASDQLKALKWLDERYGPYPQGDVQRPLLTAIVNCVSVDTLRWVSERYGPRQLFKDEDEEGDLMTALGCVVSRGSFHVLSWLFEHGRYGCVVRKKLKAIVELGLSEEVQEILDWAKDVTGARYPLQDSDLHECTQSFLSEDELPENPLPFLQWYHKRCPEQARQWITNDLISSALRDNDLELLEWLHSLQVMTDEKFFSNFRPRELLRNLTTPKGAMVLRWLHRVCPQRLQRTKPSKDDATRAAGNYNNQELLQCMEDIWGGDVMSLIDIRKAMPSAASQWSVRPVRYLQQLMDSGRITLKRQCSTGSAAESTIVSAANPGVVGSCQQEEGADDAWKRVAVIRATRCGDVPTLEYLWQSSYDFSRASNVACRLIAYGCLDPSAFLLSKSVTVTTVEMLNTAKRKKQWDALYWLAKTASPAVYQNWLSSISGESQ